jgi:protein-S-isoprenylcysteine O-methyltransferase Ste14
MAWKVTFLIAMVFSFFQPLKCAGYWLLLGAGVCLGGFALWLWAIVAIITSERCKPFVTGPYAHSRHPMYIAHALVLLGISISTASVGFLTISLILISLSVLLALDEEASCLLHFGEEYKRYMDATPRWLGT